MHLYTGRLLQLVEAVLALHDGRHPHEVLKLGEGTERFVSTPGRLNFNGGEDGAIRAFEHDFGVGHGFNNLLQIDYKTQKVVAAVLIELKLSNVQHLLSVQVAEGDLVLTDELLHLLNQMGQCTPPRDILAFELHELRCILVDFTLPDQDLQT